MTNFMRGSFPLIGLKQPSSRGGAGINNAIAAKRISHDSVLRKRGDSKKLSP